VRVEVTGFLCVGFRGRPGRTGVLCLSHIYRLEGKCFWAGRKCYDEREAGDGREGDQAGYGYGYRSGYDSTSQTNTSRTPVHLTPLPSPIQSSARCRLSTSSFLPAEDY
jgi:hypothetical protein